MALNFLKKFRRVDSKKRATKGATGRTPLRLRLESLEDRIAPATFTVLNTNDSGADSLRQAILNANAASGADEIHFNIPANDVGHVYYANDGVAGQVSQANVASTTAADDATISDIDPDYAHSWFSTTPQSTLPAITR